MKTPKKSKPAALVMTATALGELWGVTRQAVAKLTDAGVIRRRPDGSYDAAEATRVYVSHLKRPGARATVSAAHSELRRQQAEMVRLKLARMKKQLVDLDEYEETIDTLCGLFVAEIEAWPARIGGRDLVLRRKIEEAVRDTRDRLAAAAAERARAAEPEGTSDA